MGEEGDDDDKEEEEEETIGLEDKSESMKTEEGMVGSYVCPTIVLSKKEERRIWRPLRRWMIVKLLGRKSSIRPWRRG